MIDGPWYITDAALADFAAICGERPCTALAERLRDLCRAARFQREHSGGTHEQWRVRVAIRGKSRRLNLSVSIRQRVEGYADQLVAVADNDSRRERPAPSAP